MTGSRNEAIARTYGRLAGAAALAAMACCCLVSAFISGCKPTVPPRVDLIVAKGFHGWVFLHAKGATPGEIPDVIKIVVDSAGHPSCRYAYEVIHDRTTVGKAQFEDGTRLFINKAEEPAPEREPAVYEYLQDASDDTTGFFVGTLEQYHDIDVSEKINNLQWRPKLPRRGPY